MTALSSELPRVEPRLRRGRIRAVHRIDKETSGLVILAMVSVACTSAPASRSISPTPGPLPPTY